MEYFIYWTLSFLILFLGENVCSFLKMKFTDMTMYFVLIGIIITICQGGGVFRKYRELILFVLFSLLYFCIRFFIYGSDGLFRVTTLLFGAIILLCAYLSPYLKQNTRICKMLPVILLSFYIVNCCLAIYERINEDLVFGMSDGRTTLVILDDISTFRSTSLWGHPLQNALGTITIMTFILTTNAKLFIKVFLWGIGFFSLLCFNARSSIVGSILILLYYVIIILRKKYNGHFNLMKMLLFVTTFYVVLWLAYFLMQSYGLGGRLLSMGLMDDEGSSAVRIDAWSVFSYIDLEGLLFGYNEKSRLLLDKAGLAIMENFWIGWILDYGLILVIVFIILMFFLLKRLYRNYSLSELIMTMSAFWLIASTNNSLAWTYIPEFIYMLCIVIFDPINKKYLPNFLNE